jgi:hypothetical protein
MNNNRAWCVVRRAWVLLATIGLSAGCQDSIVKYLGPENNELETVLTDSLRFQAWDMDNVTDTREWTWTITGPQALVHHDSFVHHGKGQITIVDAVGDTVYNRIPLEWGIDNATDSGSAGVWTVKLELFGARGRVDFVIVRAP